MSNYLSLHEAVVIASKASECTLDLIRGKKIMYRGKMLNGETITYCFPYSKFHHAQGCYWVDITKVQVETMNETDKGTILFRLEGNKVMGVKWADFKEHLTDDCMRYSKAAGHHWKLHIFHDHINIRGNPNRFFSSIMS